MVVAIHWREVRLLPFEVDAVEVDAVDSRTPCLIQHAGELDTVFFRTPRLIRYIC